MRATIFVVLFIFSIIISLSFSSLTPKHIKLTLTGEATSLQITFSTTDSPVNPSITFWPTFTPTNKISISATFNDIFTFNFPTSKKIDYISSITISPLLPATSYSYYVTANATDTTTQSDTYTFISLPDDSSPINIGIYGDLGAYGTALIETGSGGLTQWAKDDKFDFIIHNGDLAYNLDGNSGKTGEDFLDNIEPISATVPYVVTAGNHEFMGDSESFYNNWFLGQTQLGKSSNSTDPIMYYSFDIGTKLHVAAISTEVYCEDATNLIQQYQWLEKDLVAVRQRSVQPWILVFGHRQMYIGSNSTFHSRLMRLGLQCNDSSLQHCEYAPCDSGKNCAYSIEQLFIQNNVDIYFAGHVHTYNRMYPITDSLTFENQDPSMYVNPQHPVYVVSGAAGTESKPSSYGLGLEDPLTSPSVLEVTGFSFSYVTIYNQTHLLLDQIDISSNNLVDSFWIVKDKTQPPWTKTTFLTLNPDSQLACDQ